MIKRKDLVRRTYEGKICTYFDYVLKDDKEEKQLEARFSRNLDLLNMWNVLVIIDKTDISETQVYNFSFMLHSTDVPLEMVAATGLTMLNKGIVEEVQKKYTINFLLGEELKGM